MLPVDPATLAAFSATALALVLSPGPDTMLILRYGIASGRRAGFAAVAGDQLGLIVHTILAVAGLSVVVASSTVLFKGLAVCGAAYLAWLGFSGMRGPGRLNVESEGIEVTAIKACRDAVLTNVLNPKVILLFLALYPNFIVVSRGDVTAQLLILSTALIVINMLWQAPLAWAAAAVRRWMRRASVQRWVSRLTGGVLLVFAVMMLVEHVV